MSNIYIKEFPDNSLNKEINAQDIRSYPKQDLSAVLIQETLRYIERLPPPSDNEHTIVIRNEVFSDEHLKIITVNLCSSHTILDLKMDLVCYNCFAATTWQSLVIRFIDDETKIPNTTTIGSFGNFGITRMRVSCNQ